MAIEPLDDNLQIEARTGMGVHTDRAETPAGTFVRELLDAERTHDPSRLAELFTEDASLFRVVHERHANEAHGAHSFWTHYLDAFSEIRSTFENIVETPACAVLEWTSEGTLKDGSPFRYQGASLVDFTPGGQVSGFRTYYDSAAFGHVRRH